MALWLVVGTSVQVCQHSSAARLLLLVPTPLLTSEVSDRDESLHRRRSIYAGPVLNRWCWGVSMVSVESQRGDRHMCYIVCRWVRSAGDGPAAARRSSTAPTLPLHAALEQPLVGHPYYRWVADLNRYAHPQQLCLAASLAPPHDGTGSQEQLAP